MNYQVSCLLVRGILVRLGFLGLLYGASVVTGLECASVLKWSCRVRASGSAYLNGSAFFFTHGGHFEMIS